MTEIITLGTVIEIIANNMPLYYCEKYRDQVPYPKVLEFCLIKSCFHLRRVKNINHAKNQTMQALRKKKIC